MLSLRPLLALLLVAIVVPSTSAAYVAPGAALVSSSLSLREQGDDASSQPDMSSDGRYVVFTSAARNLFGAEVADPPGAYYEGGVFRRDVASGELDIVALGGLRSEDGGTLATRGAGNPSISGDGRWIAFSTGAALVAADTNEHVDVYVRDMTVPRSDPRAYELISARDGSDTAARYEVRIPKAPFRDPGADVTPGLAISDDGRQVAFTVAAVTSDLPDRIAVDAPAGQVFVRDRALRTTQLVTRVAGTSPPQPVSSIIGAVGVGSAVLSADGTTVAWAGQEAPQQTRFLPNESQDGAVYYYLWRRIADGPAAPTRRITGAVDLDDPACAGAYIPSTTETGPCYGPLADTEQGLSGITATPPALSADGRRVAFLTQSAPRGAEAVAAVDLFVTDMSPGVSRKAGTIELTREGATRDPVASGPIAGVSLSPDGRWAGVVTPRTRFLAPALRLVGDVRVAPGANELYLADIDGGTIERAVRGRDASDATDGVTSHVSVATGGVRVAFASAAENLFFGDANHRTDVFVVDRSDQPPVPPPVDEPPADAPLEPFEAAPAASRRLTVFVRRAPRQRIRLDVRAPVAGQLSVKVRGRLPDADGRPSGAVRTLGSAKRRVKRAGRVIVDVPIATRYRSRLRKAKKLDARATATLTPRTGQPYRRELSVRFVANGSR